MPPFNANVINTRMERKSMMIQLALFFKRSFKSGKQNFFCFGLVLFSLSGCKKGDDEKNHTRNRKKTHYCFKTCLLIAMTKN